MSAKVAKGRTSTSCCKNRQDGFESPTRTRVHSTGSNQELINDVVEFGGGHTVNIGIERYALAFPDTGIFGARFLLIPGLGDGIGERGD